jgi:ribosomal-protein-alanine N-acetyltransferase
MSPSFHTTRLLLRPFEESDLDNVYLGLSHPKVIKYYGVHYLSRESAKTQMTWFQELERNGTGMWWAVCSPDNAVFYGAGGLNGLNAVHKKAEIGFWLLPEYWGGGIMKEILPLIIEYGFNTMGLHRIEGLVETGNLNCKRALESLDFVHEGTMRECEIKNGQWISLDLYASINRNGQVSRT